MAVYFVYRGHYDAPSEKHVRRFEYDTVLDWAKAIFKQFPKDDDRWDYATGLLGGLNVPYFGHLFATDEDHPKRSPPKTMRDVREWFGGIYESGLENGPHHIQIYTDDDELEMAVYVFDDHYRAKNPGKTDFLLLDGWELPDGDADGTWKLPKTADVQDLAGKPKSGAPVTYAAFLAFYDSGNLDDLDGGYRVAGVQLPDLARYILTEWAETEMDGDWEALRQALQNHLKSPKGADAGFLKAIRKQPEELTNWRVYSDWLQERDEPTAGVKLLGGALARAEVGDLDWTGRKKSKDLIRVTPHMVQACFHTARWDEEDLYHQWIFFDDRWAAAHPTLAAGILTFASRWDVLS